MVVNVPKYNNNFPDARKILYSQSNATKMLQNLGATLGTNDKFITVRVGGHRD